MTVQPPPIQEVLAEEGTGLATLPYILFFNQLFTGDSGTAWTPTFTSLGSTGTPTITGRYYKLSTFITVFWVRVTPATDTTSTAGTTYIDNFPLSLSNDGFCTAVSNGLGSSSGHVIASNRRIYTPGWSALTNPVQIVGVAFL